jgi:hypothetical protein
MDQRVTYLNALTALTPQSAKIPIHFDTDREAIERMLFSLAIPDARAARVVRIADTLSLADLAVSDALYDEVNRRPDLVCSGEPGEMQFDAAGNLAP